MVTNKKIKTTEDVYKRQLFILVTINSDLIFIW